MRKHKAAALLLIAVLLLTLFLTGCNAGKPLFGYYGDIVKAWEKNYDKAAPDALTVNVEYDGVAGTLQEITDAATINEAFDALSSLRVTGEYISQGAGANAPQQTVTYRFRSDSGGSAEFTFKDGYAAIGDKLYICLLRKSTSTFEYPISNSQTFIKSNSK